MTFDVVFEQTDMEFLPQMGEGIRIGTDGVGVTFFPNVSKEGIISWTNNGNLSNPEPVNIKGNDGYTPAKGVDYWTEADKAEMVAAVITELPIYDGEVVS